MNLFYLAGTVLTYALGVGSVTTELDCPLVSPVLLEAKSITEAKKKADMMITCSNSPQGKTDSFTGSAAITLYNFARRKTLRDQVCSGIGTVEMFAPLYRGNATLRILADSLPMLNGMIWKPVPHICVYGACECRRG